MSDSLQTAAMSRLLDEQNLALQALLESLVQEHDALFGRDVATLEHATQHKQAGLASVGKLERQRKALAPDPASMEIYAQDSEVAARWECVLELSRQCREQNDLNGRMIRQQQRRVESTLELLRGKPVGDDAVYGPDGGKRQAGPTSRVSISLI